MELLKHAELLDDRQRRIIGKHYATRADAQARGSGSHVRDQYRRRRTGQPRHVVVLGHPRPFGQPWSQAVGRRRRQRWVCHSYDRRLSSCVPNSTRATSLTRTVPPFSASRTITSPEKVSFDSAVLRDFASVYASSLAECPDRQAYASVDASVQRCDGSRWHN
jgi:hypothetical protein